MGRFKPYDYSQGVLIPVSLEEQLIPGTLEFAINQLVEKHMDLSILDGKRDRQTGLRSEDPTEGGAAGILPGSYLFKEDRAGM